jgi:hypothetical protein
MEVNEATQDPRRFLARSMLISMQTELAPIQRLAVKIAAAFGDVEKELGPVPTPPSGRPRVQFSRGQVLLLRHANLSWRQIARELGASRTTVTYIPLVSPVEINRVLPMYLVDWTALT